MASDDIVLVLVALFLAGVIYNEAVVSVLETKLPRPHALTAYEVAIGVTFTLVGLARLTDLQTFWLALSCFMASGVPMIIGAHRRAGAARG